MSIECWRLLRPDELPSLMRSATRFGISMLPSIDGGLYHSVRVCTETRKLFVCSLPAA